MIRGGALRNADGCGVLPTVMRHSVEPRVDISPDQKVTGRNPSPVSRITVKETAPATGMDSRVGS